RRAMVVSCGNIVQVGFVASLFCFSSRRRHTRSKRDWSSDVCSSDLKFLGAFAKLYPQFSAGELGLYLQVGAAAIVWTAEELKRLKTSSPHQFARREDKEEFIRKTFTTLRAIT